MLDALESSESRAKCQKIWRASTIWTLRIIAHACKQLNAHNGLAHDAAATLLTGARDALDVIASLAHDCVRARRRMNSARDCATQHRESRAIREWHTRCRETCASDMACGRVADLSKLSGTHVTTFRGGDSPMAAKKKAAKKKGTKKKAAKKKK